MQIEAVIANPHFMELADAFDTPDHVPGESGSARDYPDWVFAFFHLAVGIYYSAQNVERQLHDDSTWPFVLQCVRRHWGQKHVRKRSNPALAEAPMRHHWTYFKSRYVADNAAVDRLERRMQRSGRTAAGVLGLCDGTVKLSLQHPDPRNVIFADAKTIKALNKRVRQRTYQHGGGPKTGSMQVVIVGCRGPRKYERVVLSIGQVTKRGQEMPLTERLVDGLLDAGVEPEILLYDGAMRGKHMLHYLNKGIAVISPLAKGPGGTIRSANLGPHPVHGGTLSSLVVKTKNGEPGTEVADVSGKRHWVAMAYKRERRRRRRGGYAWYQTCTVPASLGGGSVRVRVNLNARTAEHLRLFPKSDPEYVRIYPQRSQIESLNRNLDDTLYLGRAHSATELGQRADCAAWGFLVNSIAVFLHGPSNLRGAAGYARLRASGLAPP